MNKQTGEQLRQSMAEVVALPVDDPQRQEVMAAIVEVDDPILTKQWLETVAAQEQLRLELAMVPVPNALTDRLKKIPVEPAKTSTHWWRQWQAVAAMFVVAGLVGWFSLMVAPEQAMAQRWEALNDWSQSHALKSHHHDGDMWHERQNVEQIEKTLTHALGWSVSMSPFLGNHQTLVGMDVCQFDGKKIVCSQWQNPQGQRVVIYQICAKTMDFSEDFLLKQKGVMMKNSCFYLSVPIEADGQIID